MIHETLEQAKAFIAAYEAAMTALREACGVWEECDDSCCDVYLKAKYRDKHGAVRTYTTI